MLAVIETGGKQYVVSPGTGLTIERLKDAGETVTFDRVLLVADERGVAVGTPYLVGRTVGARLIGHVRGERKIVFRFHSKTRYRKLKTHRQPYTKVTISQ